MRRSLLVLAVLTALATPAAALAVRDDPGDGTLAVRKAAGDTLAQPVIGLTIDGAVVGDIERGRLVVISAIGSATAAPVVTAADGTPIDWRLRETDGALIYDTPPGSSLRFRAVGGVYKLRLFGQGIDVNVVGQGRAWLDGSLSAPLKDGMFSLDGGGWTSLPAIATSYTIGG